MDRQLKELIETRARAIGRTAQEVLLGDETDELAGIAFQWSFLLLRRPCRYLETFRHAELRIDLGLLQDAFESFSHSIPGAAGLMRAECDIIEDHNLECLRLREQG